MTIRKILMHLAISATLRVESLKWTAYAILVALGVVKEISLERKDVLSEVISWLRWIARDENEGGSEITRILALKESLGMRLMIRGP